MAVKLLVSENRRHFSKSGITHTIHTGSNKEGLELTLKAVKMNCHFEEIAYEKKKILQ